MKPFMKVVFACLLSATCLVAMIAVVAKWMNDEPAARVANQGMYLEEHEQKNQPLHAFDRREEKPAADEPSPKPPKTPKPVIHQETIEGENIAPEKITGAKGTKGRLKAGESKKMSEQEYLAKEEPYLTGIQTSAKRVLSRGEEKRAQWNAQDATVDDLLYSD